MSLAVKYGGCRLSGPRGGKETVSKRKDCLANARMPR